MTIWEYGAIAIALWAGTIGVVAGAAGMWIWTRQPAKPIRRYRRALLLAEIQIRSRRIVDTLLGRNRRRPPRREDYDPVPFVRIPSPACSAEHEAGYFCTRQDRHKIHVAISENEAGDRDIAAIWDDAGDLIPLSTRWQAAAMSAMGEEVIV